MSQWGDARVIHGVTIIPKVETDPWKGIHPFDDPIVELAVVQVEQPTGVRNDAKAALEAVQDFIGRPYSAWLELPV